MTAVPARSTPLERWRALPASARAAGATGAFLAAWALAAALLPQGAPVGIVVQGVVQGAPAALTALGLILVWRAQRVVNFSAAALGALAGGFSVRAFSEWQWPYWAVVLLAPVFGLLVGLVVEVAIIRRFASASRLVLGVATLGLTQLLGGLDLLVGKSVFGVSAAFSAGYDTPLSDHTARLGSVTFNGDQLLNVVVVPVAAAALAWFLRSSLAGVAIRGAAENEERARLLGIPVRRLHALVWGIVGALSALTFVLQYPSDGAINAAVTGPTVLLPALAAAVLAGMESMPKAFVAALAVGVVDQVARWNAGTTPQVVGVAIFVLIVGALLLRRQDVGRGGRADAQLDAAPALRSLPAQLRRLPEIRVLTVAAFVLAGAAAVLYGYTTDVSGLVTATQTIVWAMVGLSLVVLSGWSGQISLGQFAFVGVGAMVCGNLVGRAELDVFLAVLLSAAAAAVVAFVVGAPALRIPGPFLAVVSLAFASVFDQVLLNDKVMGSLIPGEVPRPQLFGNRWDMADDRITFLFGLGLFALAVSAVRGVRSARSGRLLLAVRDNDRAAQAAGAASRRQVLAAFVLSGSVCGMAGALYVVAIGGLSTGDFPPGMSVEVFSQTVIGGLGSVLGAVSGIVAMRGASDGLSDMGRLLLGGTGLLVVLWLLPGGVARLIGAVRDRIVTPIARRHGLGLDGAPLAAAAPVARHDVAPLPEDRDAAVSCRGVNVSYGSLQVLFDVDLDIASDEIVALLGTNGAGKSTVLRALCGLTRSSGTFRLADLELTGRSAEQRAREGLAMMPGGRSVFPSLTVAENLRLATWMRRRDHTAAQHQRELALERFPALVDHLDRRAGDLSGGQQQQLALAQTVMLDPKVLLIDELSLGLAPSVVAQLMDVVRDIHRQGVPVLVVEQSLNVAMALAERAVFMEKGTVRFSGPTAELADRPDLLRAVFLDGASVGSDEEADEDEGPGVFDAVHLEDDPDLATLVDLRPAGELVLRCRDVGVSFGGLRALDGVDLEVRRGEIVGLVGQNGAGKTTLLDCISGFLTTDRGHIFLGEQEITAWPAARRARDGIGRSFQEARLYPSLTVLETIAVACERHIRYTSMAADALRQPASFEVELAVAERAVELAEMLGLDQHRNKLTAQLSTGMRRIVELACLLAADPDVLLLDEPSAGVAQRETEALGPLLCQIRDRTGAAVVVIEHDMPLLRGMCDRLVAMDQGRVIAEGDPETVLADPLVVAAYLGDDAVAIERSS